MTSSRKINPPIFVEAFLLFAWIFFQNRPKLISSSLNYDEILAWEWESGPWRDLFAGVLNDTQQLLYYMVVKVSLYFTPTNNDFWVRFPSLVLGSCATLGIYYYIRKNYSLPTVVFFIANTICLHLIAFVATFNRPYSLFLFLMCWNLVLSHKLLIKRDSESEWLKWSLVVTTAALPFVHYLAFIYLFSVLTGVLLTVGPAPIKHVYSSIGKLLFSTVAAVVVTACFSYQIQFKDRISWVFDFDRDYFDIMLVTVGHGGVFLLGFFYKIKDFASRDSTEKFLATSFIVGLLLLTLSKLWIAQYFLMLTPLSLWLSSLYFEKGVQAIKEIQFLRKYVIAMAIGLFLFLNPYFIQRFKLENRVVAASDSFFKSVRPGDWVGLKHLLFRLKEEKMITSDSKVLCVIRSDTYSAERPVELYSKMYWQKDICSKYVTNFNELNDIASYDYILLAKLNSEESPREFREVLNTVDLSLSSIMTGYDYEFYRVNSKYSEEPI